MRFGGLDYLNQMVDCYVHIYARCVNVTRQNKSHQQSAIIMSSQPHGLWNSGMSARTSIKHRKWHLQIKFLFIKASPLQITSFYFHLLCSFLPKTLLPFLLTMLELHFNPSCIFIATVLLSNTINLMAEEAAQPNPYMLMLLVPPLLHKRTEISAYL